MKRLILPLVLTTVALIFLSSLFNTDMSKYKKSLEMKNVLTNGIKECAVRKYNKQTTKFGDVTSFSGNYKYKFKVQPIDSNSCFKAKAIPEDNRETWFEININEETGKVRTCGDSSKPGCDKGNTW